MTVEISGDTIKAANILNAAGGDVPDNLLGLVPKVKLSYEQSSGTMLYSTGVATVSQTGDGESTVYFSEDFSNTNYVVSLTIASSSGVETIGWSNKLVGSVDITTLISGTATDLTYDLTIFAAV